MGVTWRPTFWKDKSKHFWVVVVQGANQDTHVQAKLIKFKHFCVVMVVCVYVWEVTQRPKFWKLDQKSAQRDTTRPKTQKPTKNDKVQTFWMVADVVQGSNPETHIQAKLTKSQKF